MRGSKRGHRWFPIIMLVALTTLLIAMWRSRDRSLLDPQYRVADLHNAQMEGWLSDQDVLIRRRVKCQASYYRHNITTGRELPLSFLDHPMGDTDIGDDVLISPDGKWLFSKGERSAQVISLDGQHRYKTDSAEFLADAHHAGWSSADVAWMADSHHWVMFAKDLIGFSMPLYLSTPASWATIYNIEHPHESVTVSVPPRYRVFAGIFTPAGHFMTYSNHGSGIVLPQKLEISEFEWPQAIKPLRRRRVQFPIHFSTLFSSLISQSPAIKLLHKWRVQTPFRADIIDLGFSPKGDRIGWYVEPTRSTPPFAWLSRFLPIAKPQTRFNQEIWTSGLDGSRWSEVGHLTRQEEDWRLPLHLTWSPDGRKVGVAYNNALYVVPAD